MLQHQSSMSDPESERRFGKTTGARDRKDMERTSGWGFDRETMDTSIHPQDDFFRYANGTWLTTTRIPDDEPDWNNFTALEYETELQLKDILEEVPAKRHVPRGVPEQLVRDWNASAMNMEVRNKLGAAPLALWRRGVARCASKDELLAYLAKNQRFGISSFWNTYVAQDAKESSRYRLHFAQGGLGLPDREYYLEDDAEHSRVRDAYRAHVKRLAALAGKTPAEAEKTAETVLRMETAFARISMAKEDRRDADKTYHAFILADFAKSAPELNIEEFVRIAGAHNTDKVIANQPDFFKGLAAVVAETSLPDLKTYLDWHIVNDNAASLSEEFIAANFDFYGKTLMGQKELKPLWRRALRSINGNIGEALGALYIKRHFTAEAEKKMQVLVDDIFETFDEHLRALEWMGPKTKRKALQKLHAIRRKIGHPKRFERYRGLTISSDKYFANLMKAGAHAHRKALRKLERRTVDRNEWFMNAQTVNAYYSGTLNDIVFPAAILQQPFFDPSADDAANYASIGSVIAHEITHAFDDQGAKYDAKGNLKNWWTPEDRSRFDAKTKLLVEQYNEYESAPGVSVNGQLTVGENAADLGGLAISFDAYQRHLEKTGRKNIDGWTPEQRFFLAFAQAERGVFRDEYLKLITLNDPHAPNPFRVNGPLSNFQPFYDAFSVTKGSRLYRPPEKRAKIW